MKQGNNDRLKGKKTLKVAGFLQEWAKDDVKKKVDIIKLFASFDVALTKKGKNFTGLCPWHDDENPSLSVDQQKGLYNCFGCGESGDVVTLVQKMKGIGFQEAMEYLKKQNGTFAFKQEKQTEQDLSLDQVSLSSEAPEAIRADNTTEKTPEDQAAPFIFKRKKESKADLESNDSVIAIEDTEIHKLLKAVTDHYHSSLLTDKKAREYLRKRGLDGPDLIKTYQIGCSNNSLIKRLSLKQIKVLKQSGIINQYGKEHFANCLVFPVFKESGEIGEIYGRRMTDREPKHLYLPGKHEGIFNHKALKVYDEIILTEGIIDALSLIKLGFKNTIPLYGVNGFTDDHREALKNNLVKKVIIAFDNDDSGAKAAENLKEKLLSEGLSVSFLFPPSGKDWNEYLLKNPDSEELKTLIKSIQFDKQDEKPKDRLRYTKQGVKDIFAIDDIIYRLEGVKDMFIGSLRVNARIEYGEKKYIDDVNLSSAKSRKGFSLGAAEKLNLEPRVIESNLLEMLEYLEEKRDKQLEEQGDTDSPYRMTEEEKEIGMKFLTDPEMFTKIIEHTEILGYTGEDINKLLIYIAASTRKMDDPISVLVQAASASGKSMLIDTVRRLMPEQDVIAITSLSDQALVYISEGGLLHKLLVLGESVHSEPVEYQIREMLSSHELSRLVASKDQKTGKILSKHIKAPVIVSAMMTSTDDNINPENASRYFIIRTDESRSQTARIHKAQKQKYSRNRYEQKKHLIPEIIRIHKSAQRLLKNVVVFNHYADLIDFPTWRMRNRRDHDRFNDLVAGICFLRQYQKEQKTGHDSVTGREYTYIECDLKDYEIARQIACHILPSTINEFPPQAHKLYETIREIARNQAREKKILPEEVELKQRDIRELGEVGQMFVKNWIRTLVDYEYVKIAGPGKRGSFYKYSLVKDEPVKQEDLSLLPAVEELKRRIDKKNR